MRVRIPRPGGAGFGFGWARRRRPPGSPARSGGRITVGALLVAALVATPVAVGLASLETDTSPASFLPAGDPTLQGLQEAASSFGGDPVVVLLESAEPRQLLGPDQLSALLGLEGRLAQLPDTAAVYGPGTILNQVAATAQNFIATVSGRRDLLIRSAEERALATGASPDEARAAGEAAVADFDRRYGGLLVQGLPAGLPTLRNSGFVDQVVFDEDGQPRPRFRYVVPNQSAAAVLLRPRQDLDQAGTERLVQAVRSTVEAAEIEAERVTVTGTPAVAAELGERVRQEIPVLGSVAVLLVGACYLLVPWTRRRALRALPILATLAATALTLAAFGWLSRPLSLGVITFLPILIGIGSDFPAYLVQGASIRRVVTTACASAAGFAALALSPLPFVRDLGLALAAGTLLAVGLGLLIRRRLDRTAPERPSEPVQPRRPRPPLVQRAGILAVVGAIAAGGWAVLPQIDVEARPDQLAAGLPAVDEALRAERTLGSSGEVRILVRGDDVTTPEALTWMRDAEAAMVLGFGSQVRPIVSPPSLLEFLGPAPTPEQVTAGVQALPAYLTGAVIRPDSRQAVLSYGIELQDLQQQARLLDEIRAAMPPAPPGLDAEIVGLPVAAARGYEIVSGDRYLTNLLGIAAAGMVLAVGLRRRSDTVRAVSAALLATGWGLAAAWVVGLSLNPLTVGLGSLTVATACEFTVLLGHRDPRARLRRTVGVAALSAAMGYLALAASNLAVIREFGLLLAGVVTLSLVAAHLVQRLFPPVHAPAVSSSAATGPVPTEMEVKV